LVKANHNPPVDERNTGTCLPTGIYIHVPFCLRRCRYCDFFSTEKTDLIDGFVEACTKEIAMAVVDSPDVDSIYFGGGTPSLLSPSRVALLLDVLSGFVNLAPDTEITLEANPGTVDLNSLKGYRLAGVNRLNLGVQSFDDGVLDFLGRIHTGGAAMEAIDMARRAGFDNLGIDLIYGMAGQTSGMWEADLAKAVSACPEHVSCYMLTVEGDTEFAALERQGRTVCLDDGQVAGLFLQTVVFLENAGWRQYEISNFARPASGSCRDFRSRHNSKYWSFHPYLGLGPSAHSFDGGRKRSWNHGSLEKYLATVSRGRLPGQGREVLTTEQRFLERVYLGLRTCSGLDLIGLKHDFPDLFPAFSRALDVITRQDLAGQDGRYLRLNLKGMLRLDGICRHVADLIY